MSWHVYPENDLTEHDTENEDACICGPTPRLVDTPEGDGWIYVHHSLDGREAKE